MQIKIGELPACAKSRNVGRASGAALVEFRTSGDFLPVSLYKPTVTVPGLLPELVYNTPRDPFLCCAQEGPPRPDDLPMETAYADQIFPHILPTQFS